MSSTEAWVFVNGPEYLETTEREQYFLAHSLERGFAQDYREYVRRGLAHLGLRPFYADEVLKPKHILLKICEEILASRLVVCDISNNDRKNVFLELGIASGLNKPTIITQRAGIKVPASLAGLDIVKYRSMRELERSLKTRIDGFEQQSSIAPDIDTFCYVCSRARDHYCAVGSDEAKNQYLIACNEDDEDFATTVSKALTGLSAELVPSLPDDDGVQVETKICRLVGQVRHSRFGIYNISSTSSPTVFLQLGMAIGSWAAWRSGRDLSSPISTTASATH